MIVLVAAFLRFHRLPDIEHNVDQAYPIWQALTTLEHGVFPLAGQGTSVLFANPALTGYLYLPFVALTRSPLGAYLLVIALNTLGVFLAFRAGRALLGVRPALVAAALLAVNPWVIEYSRTTWVQSLLPFFAPALAWLLWPLLLGRSKHLLRRTILAGILLAAYTQTYLLAFLSLLPVSLLVVVFRRNVPRKGLLVGAGIVALATVLYGIGLLGQAETVSARVDEFSDRSSRLSAEAWGHAVRLVSGEDYERARGQAAPIADAALRHDLAHIAHVAVYAALLAGVGLALLQFLPARFQGDTKQRGAAVILLVWFGLPVALMSYVGQPVHPFYQLIGLPAGGLLAAWGLCAVFRAHTRWGWRALVAALAPFMLLMAVNSIRFAEETAATPGIDGLGALPLDAGLRLGRAINHHLPAGGIVFADVDEWTLNSFAGRTFPLSRDTRAPAVQIIPQGGALYIQVRTGEVEPVPFAERVEQAALRDGASLVIDRYPPALTLPVSHPLHIASEQGLAFLGYDLMQTAQAVTLTTFWKVEGLTPETAGSLYAPFAHLFDSSGARVQIVDGQILAGGEWGPGDIHIHRLAFNLPDAGAPFTVQVGQYDSVHNRNIIFLPDYSPAVALDVALQ